MSREPRSWPRCGSGSSDVSVETLRRGLARAENPSGVIRGRTVPRPSGRLVALQAERSSAMASSSSSSAPTVNGNAMALIASPLSALPPPPPRPAPMDREKALDLRRAHKLIKFVKLIDRRKIGAAQFACTQVGIRRGSHACRAAPTHCARKICIKSAICFSHNR